jgi:hypothetical protein
MEQRDAIDNWISNNWANFANYFGDHKGRVYKGVLLVVQQNNIVVRDVSVTTGLELILVD